MSLLVVIMQMEQACFSWNWWGLYCSANSNTIWKKHLFRLHKDAPMLLQTSTKIPADNANSLRDRAKASIKQNVPM